MIISFHIKIFCIFIDKKKSSSKENESNSIFKNLKKNESKKRFKQDEKKLSEWIPQRTKKEVYLNQFI
jgi:hypothetical protein